MILDQFTITKDIPDAYYDAQDETYRYDFILNISSQKSLGITLTILLVVALVIVDLLIMKRKKVRSLKTDYKNSS